MAISQQTRRLYEFGAFRIDSAERVLLRDGAAVPLTPKVFDILLMLVENTGHIVEKDKLMKGVWPDSFVEESNLTQNVSTLRKALAEGAEGHEYVQTIARRGYRFVAHVTEVLDEGGTLIVEERSQSRLVIERAEETSGAARYAAETEQAIQGKARTASRWERRASSWRLSMVAAAVCLLVGLAAPLFYLWITSKRSHPEPAEEVKKIAVLPFKPLVADSRNESLELGMADTLINKLSDISQLIVRPISEVRKYTALEQDPIAAGRELRVDYVLEGNLQMIGEATRATVRLLSVKDGSAIWTDKCDKQCSNIFELQDSIAERVAGALSLRLTGVERNQLAKRYTENTAAYQLYLNGFFYSVKDGSDNGRKALDYYNQAIALDPNFALAYAAVSKIYRAFWRDNVIDPQEAKSGARAAALKALELDETLAEAHSALAYINRYEWDWSGAETEFKRAIELNPNLSSARNAHSFQLSAMGRHSEALAENRRAQELDPLMIDFRYDEGLLLLLARRYDESLQQGQNIMRIEPGSVGACENLGRTYAAKGMYAEAIAAFQKAISLAGERTNLAAGLTDLQCFLGNAYALSGKRHEALVILDKLKATKEYVSPALVATIYAGLGDKEEAFRSLEKAYAAHDLQLRYLKTDPAYDNLHADLRFTHLLGRVGLPQ